MAPRPIGLAFPSAAGSQIGPTSGPQSELCPPLAICAVRTLQKGVVGVLLVLWALCAGGVQALAADAAQTFSGLQVPRFVTLKTGRVNLRAGPSMNYAIKQVYVRK